jgi:hypothetical protein
MYYYNILKIINLHSLQAPTAKPNRLLQPLNLRLPESTESTRPLQADDKALGQLNFYKEGYIEERGVKIGMGFKSLPEVLKWPCANLCSSSKLVYYA